MYNNYTLIKYQNIFYIYIKVTHVPMSKGTTTVIVRGGCPIFIYGVCRIIDYELNCVKPNWCTKYRYYLIML